MGLWQKSLSASHRLDSSWSEGSDPAQVVPLSNLNILRPVSETFESGAPGGVIKLQRERRGFRRSKHDKI